MKHWKGVTLPKTTILSRQGGGGGSLCAPETEKSCGAMGRLPHEHTIVLAIRINH